MRLYTYFVHLCKSRKDPKLSLAFMFYTWTTVDFFLPLHTHLIFFFFFQNHLFLCVLYYTCYFRLPPKWYTAMNKMPFLHQRVKSNHLFKCLLLTFLLATHHVKLFCSQVNFTASLQLNCLNFFSVCPFAYSLFWFLLPPIFLFTKFFGMFV